MQTIARINKTTWISIFSLILAIGASPRYGIAQMADPSATLTVNAEDVASLDVLAESVMRQLDWQGTCPTREELDRNWSSIGRNTLGGVMTAGTVAGAIKYRKKLFSPREAVETATGFRGRAQAILPKAGRIATWGGLIATGVIIPILLWNQDDHFTLVLVGESASDSRPRRLVVENITEDEAEELTSLVCSSERLTDFDLQEPEVAPEYTDEAFPLEDELEDEYPMDEESIDEPEAVQESAD